MEYLEIQERLEKLYSLNKSLIRAIENDPDYKADKRKKDIVLLLDEASNSYYRAHITSSKIDA